MNSLLKKFLMIISICLIITTCFNYLGGQFVYAEINHNYADTSDQEPTSDANKQEGSTLLGLLGICIFSFGTLIEWLTSWIMKLFAGAHFFPWADRIIFNNIAILDCNFINPDSNSLFMRFPTIGNTIRGVYFTGLSISLGFLGIVVAVMAIKIALSTIASEKAKYKESIKDWITAMILIFGLHYLLAFCFFLNEKLVEVASQIVLNVSGNDPNAIKSMGESFKTGANTEGVNLFNLKKINVTEATLYTVLVIQSLMFLFAYLKRFFYVVILGVIGPFVVIYDFLTKVI